MNAKKFIKDGQDVWSKELEDGRTINSVCIEVNDSTLDMVTLFERSEKSMVWLKGENADSLVKQQDSVITQINKGVIKPYRAFSETPFYEGQEEDINPSNEAKLGRFSQIRLCTADQHPALHRQYVKVDTLAAPAVVEQPAINA